MSDSTDVAIAKCLLDHANRDGFTFQGAVPGVDAPLVGRWLSPDALMGCHVE